MWTGRKTGRQGGGRRLEHKGGRKDPKGEGEVNGIGEEWGG